VKASAGSLGNPHEFRKGFYHVKSKDKKLAPIMEKRGVIEFRVEGEIFESLVESILSQQLAGPAASAIIKKVRAIYPDGILEAGAVQSTQARKLREAGVSPQKLGYIKDLARRVCTGEIDLEALRQLSDEEIVAILDKVKGVGPWTVQMLLIFTLGRPNVLPVDDFGIRKGIQQIYALHDLPKRAEIEKLAESWHPYCSVASLYIWQHKDAQ